MSGVQSGIHYSIASYVSQYSNTNYHAKHILFDNGKCWVPANSDIPFTGDAITVDMGGDHLVNALEIKNGVRCAKRSTKHARIHGSLNENGPWTLLLDRDWGDPDPYPSAHTPATMELHTVPETRVRYLKLEIVESTGELNLAAWEYLRALTGEKEITKEVHRMCLFSADQAEDSKFTGPTTVLNGETGRSASCSSQCSIYKKQGNYKSAKCAQTACPASGRRRRRATAMWTNEKRSVCVHCRSLFQLTYSHPSTDLRPHSIQLLDSP